MATFHLGWRLPSILMDLFKASRNRRRLKLIFNLMYSRKKFLQNFMTILHSVLSSNTSEQEWNCLENRTPSSVLGSPFPQNQTNSPVHCSPLWAKKPNETELFHHYSYLNLVPQLLALYYYYLVIYVLTPFLMGMRVFSWLAHNDTEKSCRTKGEVEMWVEVKIELCSNIGLQLEP